MQMKKNKIIEEIDKTLDSVSSFERYEGNPFLFTRIEAKINNIKEDSVNFSPAKKYILSLQPIILLLIISLNIWTAATFFSDRSDAATERDFELNNIIEEYSLSSSNYVISALDEQKTNSYE